MSRNDPRFIEGRAVIETVDEAQNLAVMDWEDFEYLIRDQFDEMLRRAEKYPLVFAISLHPFVIGQPFRMAGLRRALDHVLARRDGLWLARPGEIARYCATLPAGVVPDC